MPKAQPAPLEKLPLQPRQQQQQQQQQVGAAICHNRSAVGRVTSNCNLIIPHGRPDVALVATANVAVAVAAAVATQLVQMLKLRIRHVKQRDIWRTATPE